MSLLLDALRQAEKNKTNQSEKNADNSLTNENSVSDLAIDLSTDDESVVELDILPDLELSSIEDSELLSEDGQQSNLIEDDIISPSERLDQQLDSSQQQGLSLEEADVSNDFEEVSELLSANDIIQDNMTLADEAPIAEIKNEKNNDLIDDASIANPDLQQPLIEETEAETSELDADAINVLQTSNSTNKKTLYGLSLFFLLGVLCIAGYLYSLTITPTVQMVSDEASIEDAIDDPFLVDATNTSNVSDTSTNHSNIQSAGINQAKAELKSNEIDPVLAVLARPEQNNLAVANQTVRKNKQHSSVNTKPIAEFYIEEDEKSIDYPKKINIKVKRQQSTVVKNLFKAYSAYRKQDYSYAESLYKQVLTQDRSNIDALLGLAAIAEQSGDIRRAQLLFEKVLTLNANHVIASNALIRLQKGQHPAENESRYKTLIEQFPDRAEAYAALANIYASKQQWHEAQEAYFNAVERSPETSYYHFNLAVSLDHLSKKTAAIQYYQKALQLSDSSQTMFDKSVVEQRIQQLQGQQ